MTDNHGNNAISKARSWNVVVYPENMTDDWKDSIVDLVPFPLAYCVHDKDVDSQGEKAKLHAHVLVVFPNTTTRKHVLEVFNQLSRPGCKCTSTAEACLNVRRSYEYLIHNTDNAIKKGKHLYDRDERIEVNNFDIARYEQLSQQEKDEMLKELCDFVISRGVVNMRQCYILISKNFSNDYFPIFKANNAMLARLCRGNYQDDQLERERNVR